MPALHHLQLVHKLIVLVISQNAQIIAPHNLCLLYIGHLLDPNGGSRLLLGLALPFSAEFLVTLIIGINRWWPSYS